VKCNGGSKTAVTIAAKLKTVNRLAAFLTVLVADFYKANNSNIAAVPLLALMGAASELNHLSTHFGTSSGKAYRL
jgi:hypothetical protein